MRQNFTTEEHKVAKQRTVGTPEGILAFAAEFIVMSSSCFCVFVAASSSCFRVFVANRSAVCSPSDIPAGTTCRFFANVVSGVPQLRSMTRRLILSLAVCGVAVGLTGFSSQRSVHAANVTFSENVAPIVFNHCTTCHRPGEAAPFTLMNYDDVRTRAKLIATVTETRRMPPLESRPRASYAASKERAPPERCGDRDDSAVD